MLRHESNGKEILQTWDSYSTPHAKLQVTCSIQSRGADCCTCTVSGASLIPYGIMMAVVVPFAATGRTPLAALLSHVEDTVHMHMHCDIWMRPSPNSTCTGDVETLPTRPRMYYGVRHMHMAYFISISFHTGMYVSILV